MLYAGIDAGQKGAVGAIRPDGKVVLVRDMPLTEDGELDFGLAHNIFDELLDLDPCIDVTIEAVHPMPHREEGVAVGHGTISAFKLGMSYGGWRAELASRKIRPNLYKPAAWKLMMMAGLPKGKLAAVQQAERLFPGAAHLFRTKRGRLLDGRAESLLLAELGRRTWRLSHGAR
jgi:hypothetical protein